LCRCTKKPLSTGAESQGAIPFGCGTFYYAIGRDKKLLLQK